MASSTQLLDWNMIAGEVSAGRMIWTGSAQSGTHVPSWSEFYGAVLVSSTGAYSGVFVPQYSQLIAYAVYLGDPSGLTLTKAARTASGTFTAAVGSPDGYVCQWYKNGVVAAASVNLGSGATSTGASNSQYSSGDTVMYTLRAYKGALYGSIIVSPSDTF